MAGERMDDFDVVVVGGGIAGLCAGVRAAELGLGTVVMEKASDPSYPCSSRISGGVFHVAHEDIRMPPDHLFRAIERSTCGHADPALAATLANDAGSTIDWLSRQGVRFINSGPHARNTAMAAPPRPLDDDLDWLESWKGRGPDVLLDTLAKRLEALGGKLMLGSRATKLLMRDGRCTGVAAMTTAGELRLSARSVVLCDGGFSGDAGRLAAAIATQPHKVLQRNAGTANGDGLRMAETAGAGITSLLGFYGHVVSRDALTNRQLWPYPLLDELCVRGIVVDAAGQRFCDEGIGGVYVANRIAALDDPLSAVVISDDATWNDITVRKHVSIPNPKLEKLGGTIHRANSIDELAERAGLPLEPLRRTIEAHNRAIATGDWQDVHPARSSDQHTPRPILTPPFLAIPAVAGLTFTMGGIRIDGDARVLDREGKIIEGLYAAGSTTGGLEGGERHSYVSGLAKAAVFGKRAAEHIAACLGRRTTESAAPPTKASAGPRRYPTLAFIVRHGARLAAAIACLPLLALAWGLWTIPEHAVVMTVAALAGSGITYLLARSYVELVAVVVDMLLPH
ncbi:FAD-dependent oxidoreductase [Pseudochelatococcus sp. B33]